MDLLNERVCDTERTVIIELLAVLSESLVETKTPTQRLAILDDMDFLFAQLSTHQQTDA
jgi:hypothetical protein